MIKYLPETVSVVFEEIPDKVTLMIEISRCQNNCKGCHSPWLRTDMGEELTKDTLKDLVEQNKGINCVLFSGEGDDHAGLVELAAYVHELDPELKVGVYSGREDLGEDFEPYTNTFDYIKVGPYREEFGPLNKETTNQRLFEKTTENVCRRIGNTLAFYWDDITSKFWRKC